MSLPVCLCSGPGFFADEAHAHPLCPVHGDPRDHNVIPSLKDGSKAGMERLIAAVREEEDAILLTFRVKVDREGWERYKAEMPFPEMLGDEAAELIAEAKSLWQGLRLVTEAQGWRSA